MLCGLTAAPVDAQNLEAGKAPSQIFSSTCSLCHKSSRGLLKSVAPGSLPGFLRQHYTTSSDMAGAMAAYVMSNGAANAALPGGNLTRQGEDSRTAPKPSANPDGRPEPKPELASREGTKDGNRGRRPVREAARPDVDGLQNIPNVLEPAAEENAKPSEPSKPDANQKSAKGRAKNEPPKTDAKREPPKQEVATRPDPVPEVTPAPSEDAAKPQGPRTVAELPTGPLSIDMGTPAPLTVTTEPAGPPRVPISQ